MLSEKIGKDLKKYEFYIQNYLPNIKQLEFENKHLKEIVFEKISPEIDEEQLKLEKAELQKALIDLLKENINNYYLLPNSYRKSAEEFYKEEIQLLEKQLNKSWEEIKDLK